MTLTTVHPRPLESDMLGETAADDPSNGTWPVTHPGLPIMDAPVADSTKDTMARADWFSEAWRNPPLRPTESF